MGTGGVAGAVVGLGRHARHGAKRQRRAQRDRERPPERNADLGLCCAARARQSQPVVSLGGEALAAARMMSSFFHPRYVPFADANDTRDGR